MLVLHSVPPNAWRTLGQRALLSDWGHVLEGAGSGSARKRMLGGIDRDQMDGKGHLIDVTPPHLQIVKPRPTNERPLAQGHTMSCRKSVTEPA